MLQPSCFSYLRSMHRFLHSCSRLMTPQALVACYLLVDCLCFVCICWFFLFCGLPLIRRGQGLWKRMVMWCGRKQRHRHRNATGCLAAAFSAGAHGIRWVSTNHISNMTSCLKRPAVSPHQANTQMDFTPYSSMWPHLNERGVLSRRNGQRSEVGNGESGFSSSHTLSALWGCLHNRINTLQSTSTLKIKGICFCAAACLSFLLILC